MVRPAKPDELGRILEIYAAARRYMAENGNPAQWGSSYPRRELLEEDLRRGQLYVVTEGDKIHGAFVLALGEETTYAEMENGAWEHDGPYGTIHRGRRRRHGKGVFAQCVAYCRGRMECLRIDTHERNGTMRHLIEKHGFARRGVIHVEDGSRGSRMNLTGLREKTGKFGVLTFGAAWGRIGRERMFYGGSPTWT